MLVSDYAIRLYSDGWYMGDCFFRQYIKVHCLRLTLPGYKRFVLSFCIIKINLAAYMAFSILSTDTVYLLAALLQCIMTISLTALYISKHTYLFIYLLTYFAYLLAQVQKRRGSKVQEDDDDEEIVKYFKVKPENQVVKLGEYSSLLPLFKIAWHTAHIPLVAFEFSKYVSRAGFELVVESGKCIQRTLHVMKTVRRRQLNLLGHTGHENAWSWEINGDWKIKGEESEGMSTTGCVTLVRLTLVCWRQLHLTWLEWVSE